MPGPRDLAFRSRLVPAGLALTALIALAAPLSAQDGAAAGMGTAEEPLDLADPASPDLDAPQDATTPPQSPLLPAPDGTNEFNAAGERQIGFEADTLSYESDGETITATGNVVLRSGDRSLRADQVRWARPSGEIVASGRVRFVDENGNQVFSERIVLTDEFEAGAMEDLLLALRQGGRLAAESATRDADGTIELNRAAYSGCAVTTAEGCPKDPSWRITAERVVYDPEDNTVRFRSAYFELFGMRLLPLPALSLRTDGGAAAGFLVPDFRFSESNGVEVSGSYYWRLAPNRDLTASAYLFSDAPPMISGQYRELNEAGAYQITGYLTQSRRSSDLVGTSLGGFDSEPRGYIFANGRYQFDPNWSLTGSIRAASDRTFLRRYDLSRDDRLRSVIEAERIDADSYLSIAGWATQTLRLGDDQGQVPFALPAIDFRQRLADPLLGGRVELQANTLALLRSDGQDTQRAFARARWDLERITAGGQVLKLTGLVRGDVYHSSNNALTPTPIYRGETGWQGRGIALGAVEMSWPLVGELFDGQQVLSPRVQIVASPPIRNLAIPNEDARAIDLEDSNLFALNRFPGYDRIEDGARITYGVDWQFTRPGWRLESTLGQSYRLNNERQIIPDGTGLSERVSDFVGRTQLRVRDFFKVTHRFRLDKDSFAVRRNEIDATIGSSRTYAEIGYLRLDRDITLVEDLQDREEARAAVRVAFADYWSIFGSGIFNLTDAEEDPSFTSDGFEPIRTRLGIAYQDDCLEMGVTWRRDYVTLGDAQRGNTFQLYFSLRNLGVR